MHNDIKKAIEVLRNGGVILYPTDTIWGIGCDATNEAAVKRVYEIKQRADNKAMLALALSFNVVENYVEDVPEIAFDLIDCAEKPLTVIYDNAKGLATNLLGENNSIGIRIPKDKFVEQLLIQFRKPIVSTSANISGTPAPQNFSEISDEIKEAVDYVVEHRQEDTSEAQPSSIIQLKPNGEVKIIRE